MKPLFAFLGLCVAIYGVLVWVSLADVPDDRFIAGLALVVGGAWVATPSGA